MRLWDSIKGPNSRPIAQSPIFVRYPGLTKPSPTVVPKNFFIFFQKKIVNSEIITNFVINIK